MLKRGSLQQGNFFPWLPIHTGGGWGHGALPELQLVAHPSVLNVRHQPLLNGLKGTQSH